MRPASRRESAEEGVTQQRPRSSPGMRPGDAARAERYEPPTAAEVGRAAALCFQDTLTDEQIARQLGIVRRTLARWKQRPEFAAALTALQAWQELAGGTAAASEASRVAVQGRRPGEDISRDAADEAEGEAE